MSLCKHPEEVCCNMTLHGGTVYCDFGFCVLHDDPPPKTNADHIRSLTDEELAKYLVLSQQDAMYMVTKMFTGDGPDPTIIRGRDLENKLNWLKQPYKPYKEEI